MVCANLRRVSCYLISSATFFGAGTSAGASTGVTEVPEGTGGELIYNVVGKKPSQVECGVFVVLRQMSLWN